MAFVLSNPRVRSLALSLAVLGCSSSPATDSQENETTGGNAGESTSMAGSDSGTQAGAGGAQSGAGGADSSAGESNGGQTASAAQISVAAGDLSRDHSIVSFMLPGVESKTALLETEDGTRLPLQVDEAGVATFILPELAAGAEQTYTIVEDASAVIEGATAEETGSAVQLGVDGSQVLSFVTDGSLPGGLNDIYLRGGYLHPLFTPSGLEVTGDYPGSHPHHHGIWSAWTRTQFNGHAVDFWNMQDGQGKVDFVSLASTWQGAVHAGFSAELVHTDLVAMPPAAALNEHWIVTVYRTHDGPAPYFVFDLVSTQETASNSPLQLEQYTYGGFGMRGSEEWENPNDVTFLTSEGLDRLAGENQAGRWCHMGGDVNGQPAGFAMLGHPDNFRAPQKLRLHPDMPYLSFAPVKDGAFNIEPGTPYVSRFRFVVSDGAADTALLEQVWNDFATPAVVTLL